MTDDPRWREAALIARLLRDAVELEGRLLVGPVYPADVAATLRAFVDAGIAHPGVVTAADRNGKARGVVWASPKPSAEAGR
ncbi:MAG TPA: hypothetical protein VHG08_00490 [Longimicrobium sp.]|nr:hypothetical protein [Longimicrobium sp.]